MEKIDFSNIEAFTPITADGYYVLKISGYETGASEMKGTPYIRFKCVTESNESINVTFYMSEKALWRFKKFMVTLDYEMNDILDPEELAKTAVGKKFIGTVRRCAPSIDPATGEEVESKYFEVTDFAREVDRKTNKDLPF